jgi:lysophospholipase L1-like esterase
MLECLIIGDSIAVGIGQARSQCVTLARSGITSEAWYKGYFYNPYFRDPYRVVVISLGTNDMRGMTSEMLFNIRQKITAPMVIWILPSSTLKPVQVSVIKEIANEFKDKTLSIYDHIGSDGIHPTNQFEYHKINDKLKQLVKK